MTRNTYEGDSVLLKDEGEIEEHGCCYPNLIFKKYRVYAPALFMTFCM